MEKKDYDIILASGSPRRSELLKSMNISFRVLLKPVDEDYPDSLAPDQVPEYLARKKASVYEPEHLNQVFITADTLVLLENEILGKPRDPQDAFSILRKLSGKTHKVITGVCLKNGDRMISFSDLTLVSFSEISDSDIDYYIKEFQPFDKAGAYGIQEWIGSIAIESIMGSYNNVMGLPTGQLYKYLRVFLNS